VEKKKHKRKNKDNKEDLEKIIYSKNKIFGINDVENYNTAKKFRVLDF
jgi:hypothetical protein